MSDIYEAPNVSPVILEMPGVEKSNVSVRVEDNVLSVEGRLELGKYQGLVPLYTEYNVGHYTRMAIQWFDAGARLQTCSRFRKEAG